MINNVDMFKSFSRKIKLWGQTLARIKKTEKKNQKKEKGLGRAAADFSTSTLLTFKF